MKPLNFAYSTNETRAKGLPKILLGARRVCECRMHNIAAGSQFELLRFRARDQIPPVWARRGLELGLK